MKISCFIVLASLALFSCSSIQQPENEADSLPGSGNAELSILESKLIGKWDLYRVSELQNALPLYDKHSLDEFYVSRKHDWMEFSSNRVYRECYFGETETKSLWFEADDVTMRYQLLNQNDEVLRIEHYDFKGPDTLLTSMDNAQFVWVKR